MITTFLRRVSSRLLLLSGLLALIYLLVLNSTAAAAPVTQTVPPDDAALINIAHFAPFADAVENTAVTVRVDGNDLATGVAYGGVVNGLTLPSGEHLVEIVVPGADGDDTVAISGTVTLANATAYTLIAIGDGDNQPLELLALVDDTTPDPSMAKLRVGHLAPFAADVAGTAIDICLDNGIPVPGLNGIEYGVVAEQALALPAGTYDLLIALAGSNCEAVVLDLEPIALEAGDLIDAFAIGKNNDAFPLAIASTRPAVAVALYLPLVTTDGAGQPTTTNTVADVVAEVDELSVLERSIRAAGLVDALDLDNLNRSFTFFAPTNIAFDELPASVLIDLLRNPQEELLEILSYHVIPETVPASEFTDGLTKETLQGATLTFNVTDDGAHVNGIDIERTDIFAVNGVIHTIDGLLLPPSEE